METAIKEVMIFKGGEQVATANQGIRELKLTIEGLPPATFYSLPVVSLSRISVFQHLQRKPLSSFFDDSSITIERQDKTYKLEPMRYIHGRSEVMRGNCTVSAVVLANFDEPVEDLELKLPQVYKAFATAS